jgi:ABC-2 type transport system permease protein
MRAVIALAHKDLRILFRIRSGLFFSFVWPVIVAVLFGFVFASQGAKPAPLRIAVVDEDATEGSRAFMHALETSADFVIDHATPVDAETMVRRGQRSAFVVIGRGFGERGANVFSGVSQHLEIAADPARQAEVAMIEGLITKHVMADFQQRVAGAGGWQPLTIAHRSVSRERKGPSNGFDVTFPQGIVWGIIGCVMTFAIGLVTERVRGTLVRLQMAPLTHVEILGGKALACFAAISLLQILLLATGIVVFGVRPQSAPLLLLACICASLGFVGFMMMIASLGKTEQAVAGAGWAMMMPMALFGGAMMPQFVMPPWMQTVGTISPVKWAILAFEGAIWRGFTLGEMVVPCSILLGFGAVCFALGVRGLRHD